MHTGRTSMLLAVALLAPLACSDDGGGGDADGSLIRLARQVPADALQDDGAWLVLSDLDAATEQAGLQRPDSDEDDDEVRDWFASLAGLDEGSDVAMLVPVQVQTKGIADVEETRAEQGWAIGDLKRFVETRSAENILIAETGSVTADALDDTLERGDDDSWVRESGGASSYLALEGDTLVDTRSEDLLDAWREGDDTLADDDRMMSIVEALDAHHVYSAMVLLEAPGPFDGGDDDGDAELMSGFESVAVGLTADDGQPSAVLVYAYGSDDQAEEAVDRTEDVLTDGTSLGTGNPLSDYFGDVDVRSEGSLVVATADVRDRPTVVWQMIANFDVIVAAG